MPKPNLKNYQKQDTTIFVSPGDYRSGRGGGVQGGPPDTWVDKHALGDIPKDFPQSGQAGDPSAAPSVTMSQIQQQHMTDDDIEYWSKASFDPPWVVNGEDMGQGTHHIRENSMLRKFIRKFIIENVIDEDELEDEGDKTEEVSTLGGGAIRGYTTPLGTGGNREKDRLKKAARWFGGGKIKE